MTKMTTKKKKIGRGLSVDLAIAVGSIAVVDVDVVVAVTIQESYFGVDSRKEKAGRRMKTNQQKH